MQTVTVVVAAKRTVANDDDVLAILGRLDRKRSPVASRGASSLVANSKALRIQDRNVRIKETDCCVPS